MATFSPPIQWPNLNAVQLAPTFAVGAPVIPLVSGGFLPPIPLPLTNGTGQVSYPVGQ